MLSKLDFFVILLVAFVDYLGIGLVYPIFAALLFDPYDPLIPESFPLAYRGAILGILIGLTPLTQFFSCPILGRLSDLKGRQFTLLYGVAIGCLGYLLSVLGIWTHSLTLLFLYRILLGISEGTIAVVQAMIADISSEENKIRRFALFNASIGTGFTIGPFLGGKLADPSTASWCGYATPFIVAGLMSAVNLLLIWRCFPAMRQASQSFPLNALQSIGHLLKVFVGDRVRWLFVAAFAFSSGWALFNEFMPLLLRDRFGFTPGDVGNYYAYGGAWYALSASLITAPLLKYFDPEKIVIKSLIGSASCMLLFLLIKEAYLIWWLIPPFMYCLSITYPTTAALVSNLSKRESQGEILGAYQSIIASAMGLSPLLAGSAIGVYPDLAAWSGASAMLFATAVLWLAGRTASSPLSLADKAS